MMERKDKENCSNVSNSVLTDEKTDFKDKNGTTTLTRNINDFELLESH